MSYEGYTEYKCACGSTAVSSVYCEQPSKCACGKPFVARRDVDETNEPIVFGEWKPIIIRQDTASFCDSVLGPPKPDVKIAIADEAKRIVSGARRSAYGKPEDNFERIARFWQAYFENTGRPEASVRATDVSPLMRLMKEARLCETPDHRDSFVDLVGYTLTGAEINGVVV